MELEYRVAGPLGLEEEPGVLAGPGGEPRGLPGAARGGDTGHHGVYNTAEEGSQGQGVKEPPTPSSPPCQGWTSHVLGRASVHPETRPCTTGCLLWMLDVGAKDFEARNTNFGEGWTSAIIGPSPSPARLLFSGHQPRPLIAAPLPALGVESHAGPSGLTLPAWLRDACGSQLGCCTSVRCHPASSQSPSFLHSFTSKGIPPPLHSHMRCPRGDRICRFHCYTLIHFAHLPPLCSSWGQSASLI